MWKKFKLYIILKVLFWSEKAVRSTRLCTKGVFLKSRGGYILNHFICCSKMAGNEPKQAKDAAVSATLPGVRSVERGVETKKKSGKITDFVYLTKNVQDVNPSCCCCCFRSPDRMPCPNYEAMEFQPRTVDNSAP